MRYSRKTKEANRISKTNLTKELEDRLWLNTNKMGVFGCFEVTIGFGWGKERVDYIIYDTNGIWRCYEVKTSRSDFYSDAKWSFIGHYNYFVMPEELYEQVKGDIPFHVGVHTGYRSLKRARKQELQVDEQILKNSLIRSLSREVQKAYKSNSIEIMQRLEKRNSKYSNELRKLRNNKMALDMLVSIIRRGASLKEIRELSESIYEHL